MPVAALERTAGAANACAGDPDRGREVAGTEQRPRKRRVVGRFQHIGQQREPSANDSTTLRPTATAARPRRSVCAEESGRFFTRPDPQRSDVVRPSFIQSAPPRITGARSAVRRARCCVSPITMRDKRRGDPRPQRQPSVEPSQQAQDHEERLDGRPRGPRRKREAPRCPKGRSVKQPIYIGTAIVAIGVLVQPPTLPTPSSPS